MPFADIDGRRIEYRLVPGAEPAMPPLVFLHEGLGSAGLWRDFPDKLARRLGARALIYSRFGYGASDGLGGIRRTPRFMHAEALDVLPRLLDRIGIGKPLLVGHSDGASIALIHASTSGRAVAGVVLMAPHVFVEAVTVQSIARIAERYEEPDFKRRFAAYHANPDDAFLGWSRIWLDPVFRAWSLGAEASALAVPALLMQGADDEYGSLAQLDAIAEVAKGPLERCVLANCGHAPHRDQAAAVIETIAAFVARHIVRAD